VIVYWLKRLAVSLLWLVRAPKKGSLALVDPNAKCPCCGARDGRLRCVHLTDVALACQHTCNVCAARWVEPAVVTLTTANAQHGVARTPVEEKEDRLRLMYRNPATVATIEEKKAS
jgi:hypothetical protein